MNDSSVILKLRDIIQTLRGESGCPWDKKQDIRTMRGDLLEETQEVIDAASRSDYNDLQEELGDLLFLILFYIRLAEEQSKFTFQDVVNSVCEKLIRRHPHVFGELQLHTEDEVLKNWDKIKSTEKKNPDKHYKHLSALTRSVKLQKKDRATLDPSQVKEKVESLIRQIVCSDAQDKTQDELFAETIFYITKLSSIHGVQPEIALHSFLNRMTEADNNDDT